MFAFITSSFFHTPMMYLMIPFALLDIKKDLKPYKWRYYLPVGLIVFSLLFQAYMHRGTLEYQFLQQHFSSYQLHWNWDNAFRKIPFNNGWLFRLFQPKWLTAYMRYVYRTAFYMNLWVSVMRGFFAKDIKKMIRYMMAGLVVQMIVIGPFYYFVLLQEVWYVQGDPDMLQRHFSSHLALLGVVKDCFPSMHTSTAFAVLLLALREKGKWFKWLMVIDCASIIVSTQYLKIHWLLDVFAGMLLAYLTVKFVDLILDKLWPEIGKVLLKFYRMAVSGSR